MIPREAREALCLKPGDKVSVLVSGGSLLLLKTPKSYRAALRGIARGVYPDGYLKRERQSWR